MSRFDHAGDAAANFAMVSMMAADPDRQERYIRRRTAAVLWIPGLLVLALAGGETRSLIVAAALFVVIVAGLLIYSERPGFLFRR